MYKGNKYDFISSPPASYGAISVANVLTSHVSERKSFVDPTSPSLELQTVAVNAVIDSHVVHPSTSRRISNFDRLFTLSTLETGLSPYREEREENKRCDEFHHS